MDEILEERPRLRRSINSETIGAGKPVSCKESRNDSRAGVKGIEGKRALTSKDTKIEYPGRVTSVILWANWREFLTEYSDW